MAITTRGVKKVSEKILAPNRALIITEKDIDSYSWDQIPVGSKFINTTTGVEKVKLEGESDWVPAGIKNDGTLCIAKDSIIIEETFTITGLNETVSGKPGIKYTNKSGATRRMQKTTEGYCVFELEEGEYYPGRNHLEVFLDDVLRRTVSSGGVIEISSVRFAIPETLYVGQEVTAKYIKCFRIGQPYPRIFLSSSAPTVAEVGDFWLDPNNSLNVTGADTRPLTVTWSNITGKPTTVSEYGLSGQVSIPGHTHKKADITDFPTITMPTSLPANGGNADTVKGRTVDNNKAGTLALIGTNGKLPASIIPLDAFQSSIDNINSQITALSNRISTLENTIKNAISNITISNGTLTFTKIGGGSTPITVTAKYI